MNEILERRFAPARGLRVVRAEGDSRRIVGYAAVFDTLSVELWGFREMVAPGAFAETLEDDVRALWNHSELMVLGRTKSGTLALREDEVGLWTETDPPASAGALLETIERGDVDQMSFGFRTLKDTWRVDENEMLIRTLLKVKLYDISPVTFPAYPATSVGVRSAEEFRAIYGQLPEIPADLRARIAGNSRNGDEQARARVLWRRRALMLSEIE